MERQAIINNQVVPYTFSFSGGTIEQAKLAYPNHTYIGSGEYGYINGIRQSNDKKEVIHFFK